MNSAIRSVHAHHGYRPTQAVPVRPLECLWTLEADFRTSHICRPVMRPLSHSTEILAQPDAGNQFMTALWIVAEPPFLSEFMAIIILCVKRRDGQFPLRRAVKKIPESHGKQIVEFNRSS